MAVAFGSAHTASGTDVGTLTVTGVTGGAGTFLCWVDVRAATDSVSVSGGGLTWTLVDSQTAGRGTHQHHLYIAHGTPSGNPFDVTVTFGDATGTRVAIVSRYTGSGGTYQGQSSSNTNGTNGAGTGGTDTSSASLTLTGTHPAGSLAVVSCSPRSTPLAASPGGDPSGWTRRVTGLTAGTLGEALWLYSHTKADPSASETVTFTLQAALDWTVIGLVLLEPVATGPGPANLLTMGVA